MQKGAIFSSDENKIYRYQLWRIWDESKPLVAFIGLNPSTADANEEDPTLKRCIRFAESWGYGGVYMINLFALKSPKPDALYEGTLDIIGEENNQHIQNVLGKVEKVICAWGNHGILRNRHKEVLKMIAKAKPHYLKLNMSGQPAHPLYLPQHLSPTAY